MALKTNYKEDVLAASNTKRKYNMITNDDGTVSFEDVTEYQQTGDNFGAGDVNQICEAVNLASSTLDKLNSNFQIVGQGYVTFVFPAGDDKKGQYQEVTQNILVPAGTDEFIPIISYLGISTESSVPAMQLVGPSYDAFDASKSAQKVPLKFAANTDGSPWTIRVFWLAIREIIL